MEGTVFDSSMISESFYGTLCIKYDFKTFKGRFSGITKSQPVGMPSNAARRTGARISMRGQVSKCVAHRDEPVQFPT